MASEGERTRKRAEGGSEGDISTSQQEANVDTVDTEGRGTWSSKFDFAMSCIAYAVGLGNVWRFPYLVFKNGGGAFLITYFLSALICGVPLFLLEVAMGQYLGVGGMRVVGQLCPIFKGVGYAALTMVFLENVYYIIVVAWTLFYLLNSVYSIGCGVPWRSCENGNGTWAKGCFNPSGDTAFNESHHVQDKNRSRDDVMTPVEAYWNHHVLVISDGIEDLGTVNWEMFGYLLAAWIFVYFVIWKGLANSGKIIWVSALLPYVILTALCVKALMLEGALDGLRFLFTPDWSRLADSQCWLDGGTQIFFSYGVGIGALLTLGSYNKFHHNCYRDVLIVCGVNSGTSIFAAVVIFSILGFMAHEKGVDIATVVQGGPGLVFQVFPEVVLRLDPSAFWSIMFFLMLLTLGINSQFCGVESLISGLVDNRPEFLRPRKFYFTIFMIFIMFLLGIPMVTNGGVYIFQLMDFYAASGMSLLWCVFFQTAAICWCFGAKTVYECIEQMIGFKITKIWYYCWMYIAPAFMVFLFTFYFVWYSPLKYAETYEYPWWGEFLGFLISLSSMVWIPAYAITFLLRCEGTLQERIRKGLTPVIAPRAEALASDSTCPSVVIDAIKTNNNSLVSVRKDDGNSKEQGGGRQSGLHQEER